MSMGDDIQIGILLVLTATLIAIVWQIRTHNRLFFAQVLRDRFDMYWKTYDPISDAQIAEFELIPDDYIDIGKYEKDYKGKKDAIHKYLICLQLYEYLAFAFKLKEAKIIDPLGQWTEEWTYDLCEKKEFMDVHGYHKKYYPEFAKFIVRILNR
ncbi:MAG: hypothetical protein ACHQX0_01140 [Desulfobaccales bacterium]